MSRRAKKTVLVDTPSPRKRAVIYKRASTNESNQPHSLATQDVEGRRFVEGKNCELVGVYEEYASGKDQNRRKLQELLRDARAGLFDVVVVQRIDRLARSLFDLLDIMKQFDEAGVAFYSVHESFESATVSGRLLIQVIGALAEFERCLLLERIHGGQRTKVVEKGLLLSRSRAPFGTRVDDATGILERDLVTNEEGVVVGGTWPLVQVIFDDYAIHGLSPKTIAKKLTDQGHRTSNGNEWSRQAVHDILKNRTYVGELFYSGEWYPAAHSAFLDEELFDRAQTILEQNAAEGAARVAQSGHTDYLLSGLFRCHSCNSSMVGTSANARGRRYRYYFCSRAVKFRTGSGCSDPLRVSADGLEQLVVDVVLEVLAQDDLWLRAYEEYRQREQEARPEAVTQLALVRQELDEVRRVLARYKRDYEGEKLTADQWSEGMAEHGPRERELEFTERQLLEQLESDEVSVPEAAVRADVVGAIRRALAEPSNPALRRRVIKGVVAAVHSTDGENFEVQVAAPTAKAATALLKMTASASGVHQGGVRPRPGEGVGVDV